MKGLTSTSQLDENFAYFSQMRQTNPIYYDAPTDSWHIFRYDDISYLLNHPAYFGERLEQQTNIPNLSGKLNSFNLVSPQNKEWDAIISQILNVSTINRLAPTVSGLVQNLLERKAVSGTLDLIEDLAIPLSGSLLVETLAVPPEHRTLFLQWLAEPFVNDSKKINNYLGFLLRQRRQTPQEDLISRLLTAHIPGIGLEDNVIISRCNELLHQLYRISINLLGNAGFCLIQQPEIVERLHSPVPPIFSTIEEVLRYLPPVWGIPTTISSKLVLGKGWDKREILAGAHLWLWLVSANHDEQHFVSPDRFDIERVPNRHLSFGIGRVYSPVAALVRLETRIALTTLIQQLPAIQRSDDTPLDVVGSPESFGLRKLLITFKRPDKTGGTF